MMRQGLIQLPRPMSEAAELFSDRSEGAEDKVDQRRRRIQNRKNQRAHRLRLKGKDTGAGQRLRPFEIRRWRLDEHNVDLPGETLPASVGPSITHVPPHSRHSCIEASAPTAGQNNIPKISRLTTHHRPSSTLDSRPFAFPLSSDHLLHLIQHNVFRAFMTNKSAINTPTGDRTNCSTSGLYRHDANLHQPLDTSFPPSLTPTTLQQNRYHSLWIKVIPFPRIRDNLIRNEGLFNHWDLMYDLVGDIINSLPAVCVGTTKPPPTTTQEPPLLKLPPTRSISNADEDDVTFGRKGLIVWGEPHDTKSWEATPGFLAKWAWVVEGCEELVEISNRWRMSRGEEPMWFPMLGSWSLVCHQH